MDEEEEKNILQRLTRIEVLVEEILAVNKARGLDHEQRLRALEQWRWGLPTSVFAALISATVAVVTVALR